MVTINESVIEAAAKKLPAASAAYVDMSTITVDVDGVKVAFKLQPIANGGYKWVHHQE